MRDESYLNITSTPVSCKCKIGLKSPSPSLAVSSVHGRLDPSAERKVARDGISAERERIECLPVAPESASASARPTDREREIRTTRNPKQAPLPLISGATREREQNWAADRNSKCSHVEIGTPPSIFLPDDNGVDTNVPTLILGAAVAHRPPCPDLCRCHREMQE